MAKEDDLKQAQLATAQAINRHSMTLLGLWLLSLVLLGFPDVNFLKTAATASIPVVGAASFKVVLVVLPLLMLAVRAHLEVYITHEAWVNKELTKYAVERVPTASHSRYPLMRRVRFFVLYLSVPTALTAMTYKGMVYVDLGAGLLGATLLVTGVLALPPPRGFLVHRIGAYGFLAVSVALTVFLYGEFRRSFQLDLAELKRADLRGEDLRGARLYRANLEEAVLARSNFAGARMGEANFTKAVLAKAKLKGAHMPGANLTKVNFEQADLTEANFRGANLAKAKNLTQQQLDTACGDEKTRLPKGLTIKPCKKKP